MGAEILISCEKRFRGGPAIRPHLSIPMEGGRVTVLFGPSGSGKSTVLRCLAGLERPDRGEIRFGEETWFDAGRRIHLAPQRRRVGFLFQQAALFPHMSVLDNVAYGLGDLPIPEADARARALLSRFGIRELEGRRPSEISGGQAQRVALARALAPQPRLLLLDEPFGGLDQPTREQIRREVRQILVSSGAPVFLVTHDRQEALALGDRVAVLVDGAVAQEGPIADVFRRPADIAVAGVVGVENRLPAAVAASTCKGAIVCLGPHRLFATTRPGVSNGVACFRGEDVSLVPASGKGGLPGKVTSIIAEGAVDRIAVDCGVAIVALVPARERERLGLREGSLVEATIAPEAIHVVPAERLLAPADTAPRRQRPAWLRPFLAEWDAALGMLREAAR